MIVRPYKASVPIAWVFIEILSRFPPIPNTKRPATNCQACVTTPSTGSVPAYSKAAVIAIGRLPIRATSQPASGKETISPAGKPSSTPPSAALSKCNFVWMLGMREAQLKKQSPARKK